MEKYARTHQEFSAPCLAGVYMLASKWWHYDRELSSLKKPDIDGLENIACTSLQSVIHRPKLSTIQGGLLLMQYQWSSDGAWTLSAQMVAVAQELGLDVNCASWTIPTWEKGLRKRLGWAVYMMDKWYLLLRLPLMANKTNHSSKDGIVPWPALAHCGRRLDSRRSL